MLKLLSQKTKAISFGLAIVSVATAILINIYPMSKADEFTTDQASKLYSYKITYPNNTKLTKILEEISISNDVLEQNTAIIGVKLELGKIDITIPVRLMDLSNTSQLEKDINLSQNSYKDYLKRLSQEVSLRLEQPLSGLAKEDLASMLPEIEVGKNITSDDIKKLESETKTIDNTYVSYFQIDTRDDFEQVSQNFDNLSKLESVGIQNIYGSPKSTAELNYRVKDGAFIKYNMSSDKINQIESSKSIVNLTPAGARTAEKNIILSDIKLYNLLLESKTTEQDVQKERIEITQIEKYTYPNPGFIEKAKLEANQGRINSERSLAEEHNKKVPQYFTPDEQDAIEATKSKTSFFTGPKVYARGLNNTATTQLMYAWNNINLALDLPGGNTNNGTQIEVHNRHGQNNQRFGFLNSSKQITIMGKCLDINGDQYYNGNRIQVWDCHGGNAQKWVFDGLYLRAWGNLNYCLYGGLSAGSPVFLMLCNTTSSQQRWVTGSNDFTTQRSVKIYATPTGLISWSSPGHAIVSFNNDFNGLTNTMTSWSGNNDSNSSNSNPSRFNNIADFDAGYVDVGYDWDTANNTPAGWKMRNVAISKTLSDVYRHNAGYRYGFTVPNGVINNNATITYWPTPGANLFNCAKLSTRIWDDVMDDSGIYNNINREEWFPSNVYNQI